MVSTLKSQTARISRPLSQQKMRRWRCGFFLTGSCQRSEPLACCHQVRTSPGCGACSPALRSSTRPSSKGRTQVRAHISRGRCLGRALTTLSVCVSGFNSSSSGRTPLGESEGSPVICCHLLDTAKSSFLHSCLINTQRSSSFHSAAESSPRHTVSPAGGAWRCLRILDVDEVVFL